MKRSNHPWLLAIAGVLLAGLALALPLHSWAQMSKAEDVLSAIPAGDASMQVFGHLIGDHLKNPFTTLGAPQTLLGTLFLTLNTFTFLVGVLYVSYGITSGIVQTAHEGQVLGRRMSAIWMPIRMVTGVAGMIPFFGGFSLAQAVMMLASLLGIGLANYGWKQVITSFDQFSGMVRPAVGEKIGGATPLGLAYGIFSSEVCAAAHARYLSQMPNVSSSERLVRHTSSVGTVKAQAIIGWGRVTDFGSTDDYCGRMEIKSLQALQQDTSGTPPTFGFSVNSVNYYAIANAMRAGIPGASQELWSAVAPLAVQWHANWLLAKDSGQMPAVPMEAIELAAGRFASSLGAAGKAASPDEGAVRNQAKQAMTRYGWFGAGAWYSTLAEAQTAMSDAFKSVEITVVDPTTLMMDDKFAYSEDQRTAMSAYLKLLSARATASGSGASDSLSLAFGKLGITNETGNMSMGQTIVSLTLKGLGTGGGQHVLVNPIIMLKNVGDYLMTAVQGYFFGESVASKVPAISAAKKFASAAGPLSGLAGKVPGVGAIFDLTDKAGMLLQMSLGALFAVGALMSLYFPFIPFIAWMGGLVQYVTIFFEGLVAAPIWAFAHLDVEGEGMGQRAERGYIFILNMLFRPFLMILGFVLAAGLLVVLGTLQMVLFMPAMANVQGNSLTGAASILILLGIFCMLNITLIHGLFNMVTLIPDQVLGWVGNMGNTQLGKEVEEKAHQMFVSLGRTMAGGVNASPAKSARDKAGDKAAASLRRGGVGSHDGKKPGA